MADLQQRSEAWHIARKGKLTASNLGAALGISSCVTRNVAFKRAIGTDKFEGNEATNWGNNNENNALVDYQVATGNIVEPTGLHIHEHHTWIAGSPDGLVGTEGMIEIKCPFYWKKNNRGRLHRSVPLHYYLQMNACLEIAKRTWCDYVCWAPEGMLMYRTYSDPMLFEYLLPYYSQFYAAVEAGASGPPPLKDKARLIERIEASLAEHVDYSFYARPGISSVGLPGLPVSDMSDNSDEMVDVPSEVRE